MQIRFADRLIGLAAPLELTAFLLDDESDQLAFAIAQSQVTEVSCTVTIEFAAQFQAGERWGGRPGQA